MLMAWLGFLPATTMPVVLLATVTPSGTSISRANLRRQTSNPPQVLSSLSYHNPCQPICSSPTHAASSAMPYERSRTVILITVSSTRFYRLGYLCHILSAVFLKDAGTYTHKNVDTLYIPGDPEADVGILSRNARNLLPPTAMAKGAHFPLPHLWTAFRDAIYDVAAQVFYSWSWLKVLVRLIPYMWTALGGWVSSRPLMFVHEELIVILIYFRVLAHLSRH